MTFLIFDYRRSRFDYICKRHLSAIVGFLSNFFTYGPKVNDRISIHASDIKRFLVYGMTNAFTVMFNTHSARTGGLLLVSHHPSSLSLLKFENKKGRNPSMIPAFFVRLMGCWLFRAEIDLCSYANIPIRLTGDDVAICTARATRYDRGSKAFIEQVLYLQREPPSIVRINQSC